MSLTAAKFAVVLPAAALTALAYSSVAGVSGYALPAALAAILLGVFLSSGSASRAVSLSMTLYAVPYTIGASQFLPVAFPEAYRNLGEAILASPYFSSAIPIFALVALGITADYVETAEEWESVLNELGGQEVGKRTLLYGLLFLLAAFVLSLAVFWLGGRMGISAAGSLLPLILLTVGLVVAYSSIESGNHRRVVVAVETPPFNGSVVIQTPKRTLTLPVSRSMGFEWETVRLEAETGERPRRVLLRTEEKEEALSPLIESVDQGTLFLLYRVEKEKVNIHRRRRIGG
ncbi:hypothetical protein [Thermococcus aciditolerans]|uniref:Uncharacterized protein n=1 Tax=Thermococcus aciditolerans TaxID=2598455 RepID=A0A5C0SLT3_9EURY|nr:hypothetical protein [Thermococcus aciditolerans]QEK15351.1 hypothetical protein FPV09_09910 [Thermococcus aciditolerans]